MGSVKEYFSTLGTGIASLLKGMKVTGKEFVTPKITERYPEDRTTRPAAKDGDNHAGYEEKETGKVSL